jgi:Zn-dependent protease
MSLNTHRTREPHRVDAEGRPPLPQRITAHLPATRTDPHPATGPDLDGPGRRSGVRQRVAGGLAALVAVVAKLKAVIFVVLKLKFVATAGTAFVSVGAYSLLFGWPFAAGFVVLLFVHEMGHVVQLRREGIKASAPMFVPFLGAVISARSLGTNALAEARVGLAGPVLGTVGAGIVALAAVVTHAHLLYALAYTGFLVNLFNLIPVTPLDGGRAMAAMAPAMWMVGLVILVAVAVLFGNPLIFIFIVIGFLDVRRRLRARREGGAEQDAYYKVAPQQRLYVGVVYLSLLVLLVAGMQATLVATS